MRDFSSEFRRRLWWKHTIGTIHKSNGRYYSMPLYHHRPPKLFQPRLTRQDKLALDDWLANVKTVGGKERRVRRRKPQG